MLRPLFQQAHIAALHQLEAGIEVCLHTAFHIGEALRSHSPLPTEATINRLRIPILESFDEHVEHGEITLLTLWMMPPEERATYQPMMQDNLNSVALVEHSAIESIPALAPRCQQTFAFASLFLKIFPFCANWSWRPCAACSRRTTRQRRSKARSRLFLASIASSSPTERIWSRKLSLPLSSSLEQKAHHAD